MTLVMPPGKSGGPTRQPMAEEKKQMGCMSMIAWFLGAVIVLVFIVSLFRGDPEPVTTCTDMDARVHARMNVENNLKNPDDADFSNSAAWEVNQSDGVWTVEGEVTATNSFNAKIKSHFVCMLKCEAGEWRYGSVTLD